MGLFDNLSRNLQNLSQNATDKAKDFADITKQTMELKDLEHQKEQLLLKLGKIYFSDHKLDPDIEYPEIMESIQTLEDKILSVTHNINDLKGMRKCPVCGEDISKDSLFCKNCGTKIEIKVCPSCHADVQAEQNFCNICGASLVSEEPNEES